MSTVKEIEAAIEKLPRKDLWELHNWFSEHVSDAWDRQMEEDAASGKLDKLWEKAQADIEAGRVKPLNEFLDND